MLEKRSLVSDVIRRKTRKTKKIPKNITEKGRMRKDDRRIKV
jgi:hypothetical protein